MGEEYKTKQKSSIFEYLKKVDGHVTADDVVNHFRSNGNLIGKACYQYVGEHKAEHHYHLICVDCGNLIHEKCGYMDEIAKHLSQKHEFTLDPLKTVLYGKCKNRQ